MTVNWNGLLKVIEVKHIRDGEVIWEERNLHNLLHQDGEEFMLRAVFQGGPLENPTIPEYYYLGLDNRQSLSIEDTITDLVGEPAGSGYQRQAVSSETDFAINFETDHFVATSPIVAFQATVGSWGPVSNLFITDQNDESGYLIATAPMNSGIEVVAGDSVTRRIGLQLRECEVDGTDGTS
jgi:hypothetical protein